MISVVPTGTVREILSTTGFAGTSAAVLPLAHLREVVLHGDDAAFDERLVASPEVLPERARRRTTQD
jgi:hypothetical protein